MLLTTDDVQTIHLGPPDSNRPAESGLLKELFDYLNLGADRRCHRLGRYHILEVLGKGGFGIVVKAVDPTLERFVAIKILAPQLAVTAPPRKNFLREARSAAQVKHENVVQIHSVEEEPLPYLVMEYIDGESLQQRLDRTGPMKPEETIQIGRQIAEGLAAAHAVGLVHRDIKPSNIMLEKGDPPVVKITDFGIARTTDDVSLTTSNVIIGTPLYMSPEQANGDVVDLRSDLFSLGSVLYTMVSGRPPFRAAQTMAVLKRIVDDNPRSVRQINPAVGAGLARVIDRLHAKSPKGRYTSAIEVAQALEKCLHEKPAALPRIPRRVVWGTAVAAALFGFTAVVGIGWAVFTKGGGATAANQANAPASLELPMQDDPEKALLTASPKLDNALAAVAREVVWENAVAAMPVEDQAPAVNARLQTLNAKYDGTRLAYTLKKGAVDTLSLVSANLADLTPLRALKELRELSIIAPYAPVGPPRGILQDLSPLRGMKLEALYIDITSVHDLTPLADLSLKSLTVWGFLGCDLRPLHGMKLTYLNLGLSKVNDLAPLRGMPLEYLCLNISEVSDLSPLKGMKLKALLVEHTKVKDLGPGWDMPLEVLAVQGASVADLPRVSKLPLKELYLDYEPARDRDLLRSIKTLEMVNHQPVAEFLAKADKKRSAE